MPEFKEVNKKTDPETDADAADAADDTEAGDNEKKAAETLDDKSAPDASFTNTDSTTEQPAKE